MESECLLEMKLYNKRDYSYFPIANFPFTNCNIPAGSAYGVYISHLIRYSRTCGSYHDILDSGMLLTSKLLHQGFLVVKLNSHFYSRHHG